jgi:hypothetical protein
MARLQRLVANQSQNTMQTNGLVPKKSVERETPDLSIVRPLGLGVAMKRNEAEVPNQPRATTMGPSLRVQSTSPNVQVANSSRVMRSGEQRRENLRYQGATSIIELKGRPETPESTFHVHSNLKTSLTKETAPNQARTLVDNTAIPQAHHAPTRISAAAISLKNQTRDEAQTEVKTSPLSSVLPKKLGTLPKVYPTMARPRNINLGMQSASPSPEGSSAGLQNQPGTAMNSATMRPQAPNSIRRQSSNTPIQSASKAPILPFVRNSDGYHLDAKPMTIQQLSQRRTQNSNLSGKERGHSLQNLERDGPIHGISMGPQGNRAVVSPLGHGNQYEVNPQNGVGDRILSRSQQAKNQRSTLPGLDSISPLIGLGIGSTEVFSAHSPKCVPAFATRGMPVRQMPAANTGRVPKRPLGNPLQNRSGGRGLMPPSALDSINNTMMARPSPKNTREVFTRKSGGRPRSNLGENSFKDMGESVPANTRGHPPRAMGKKAPVIMIGVPPSLEKGNGGSSSRDLAGTLLTTRKPFPSNVRGSQANMVCSPARKMGEHPPRNLGASSQSTMQGPPGGLGRSPSNMTPSPASNVGGPAQRGMVEFPHRNIGGPLRTMGQSPVTRPSQPLTRDPRGPIANSGNFAFRGIGGTHSLNSGGLAAPKTTGYPPNTTRGSMPTSSRVSRTRNVGGFPQRQATPRSVANTDATNTPWAAQNGSRPTVATTRNLDLPGQQIGGTSAGNVPSGTSKSMKASSVQSNGGKMPLGPRKDMSGPPMKNTNNIGSASPRGRGGGSNSVPRQSMRGPANRNNGLMPTRSTPFASSGNTSSGNSSSVLGGRPNTHRTRDTTGTHNGILPASTTLTKDKIPHKNGNHPLGSAGGMKPSTLHRVNHQQPNPSEHKPSINHISKSHFANDQTALASGSADTTESGHPTETSAAAVHPAEIYPQDDQHDDKPSTIDPQFTDPSAENLIGDDLGQTQAEQNPTSDPQTTDTEPPEHLSTTPNNDRVTATQLIGKTDAILPGIGQDTSEQTSTGDNIADNTKTNTTMSQDLQVLPDDTQTNMLDHVQDAQDTSDFGAVRPGHFLDDTDASKAKSDNAKSNDVTLQLKSTPILHSSENIPDVGDEDYILQSSKEPTSSINDASDPNATDTTPKDVHRPGSRQLVEKEHELDEMRRESNDTYQSISSQEVDDDHKSSAFGKTGAMTAADAGIGAAIGLAGLHSQHASVEQSIQSEENPTKTEFENEQSQVAQDIPSTDTEDTNSKLHLFDDADQLSDDLENPEQRNTEQGQRLPDSALHPSDRLDGEAEVDSLSDSETHVPDNEEAGGESGPHEEGGWGSHSDSVEDRRREDYGEQDPHLHSLTDNNADFAQDESDESDMNYQNGLNDASPHLNHETVDRHGEESEQLEEGGPNGSVSGTEEQEGNIVDDEYEHAYDDGDYDHNLPNAFEYTDTERADSMCDGRDADWHEEDAHDDTGCDGFQANVDVSEDASYEGNHDGIGSAEYDYEESDMSAELNGDVRDENYAQDGEAFNDDGQENFGINYEADYDNDVNDPDAESYQEEDPSQQDMYDEDLDDAIPHEYAPGDDENADQGNMDDDHGDEENYQDENMYDGDEIEETQNGNDDYDEPLGEEQEYQVDEFAEHAVADNENEYTDHGEASEYEENGYEEAETDQSYEQDGDGENELEHDLYENGGVEEEYEEIESEEHDYEDNEVKDGSGSEDELEGQDYDENEVEDPTYDQHEDEDQSYEEFGHDDVGDEEAECEDYNEPEAIDEDVYEADQYINDDSGEAINNDGYAPDSYEDNYGGGDVATDDWEGETAGIGYE